MHRVPNNVTHSKFLLSRLLRMPWYEAAAAPSLAQLFEDNQENSATTSFRLAVYRKSQEITELDAAVTHAPMQFPLRKKISRSKSPRSSMLSGAVKCHSREELTWQWPRQNHEIAEEK